MTRLKQLDSGLSGDYVTAVKNIIWGQAEVTSDVPGMGEAGGGGPGGGRGGAGGSQFCG